jgi:hypothetical protein
MALHTELPVYRDTYKLVLEIFVSTKNFPKEYKYSLGRDMERDVLVLMRCIYRANRAQEKTTFLNEFLDNFEILKLEVRVCVDLKLMSIKRQSVLADIMNSIGKQVVGWKKSATSNARILNSDFAIFHLIKNPIAIYESFSFQNSKRI